MDEIVGALSSPWFWFNSVLVAVFMNLIAAYLKPLVDLRASRASDWWKRRSQAQRDYFEKIIVTIQKDEMAAHLFAVRASELRDEGHHHVMVAGLGFVLVIILKNFVIVMTTLRPYDEFALLVFDVAPAVMLGTFAWLAFYGFRKRWAARQLGQLFQIATSRYHREKHPQVVEASDKLREIAGQGIF